MADQNIEDDFPSKVKQILEQIIRNECYISNDITYKEITTKANLLASLHEVEVKGKSNGAKKEISLFIKLQRQNHVNVIAIEDFCNREFYVYSELFKIYEELQDNVNVPLKERFKAVKYYFESTSEILILDNLSKNGFKNLPRVEVIPLIFVELCIEQLAKFHALSVVLQNQRPEYFNSKVKSFENFLANGSEERDAVVKKVFNIASKHLSDESKESIASIMDTLVEEINKHLRNSEMFSCLCHGDFRTKSFLYREGDLGIREGIIIDYQMIYYGSPIDDFAYFIFLETDREFRRKYLDHLKNLYYTQLEMFLKYFAIDLMNLWPREEFEKQFRDSLNYEIIHAMLAFPFAFVDDKYVLDLENGTMAMDVELDIRCKDRIQDLIDDFIEWRPRVLPATTLDNNNINLAIEVVASTTCSSMIITHL